MTSWKSAAFSAPRLRIRVRGGRHDNHEVVTGPKIYLNAVAEDESEFDKVRHQIVEQLNDQMMQARATPTSCSRPCAARSAAGLRASCTASR